MGAKSSKQTLSRDQQKLHAYYVPNVDEKKLKVLEGHARKLKIKYISRSLVFGFIIEYCLGVSKIYDNINRKTTTRRLSK